MNIFRKEMEFLLQIINFLLENNFFFKNHIGPLTVPLIMECTRLDNRMFLRVEKKDLAKKNKQQNSLGDLLQVAVLFLEDSLSVHIYLLLHS